MPRRSRPFMVQEPLIQVHQSLHLPILRTTQRSNTPTPPATAMVTRQECQRCTQVIVSAQSRHIITLRGKELLIKAKYRDTMHLVVQSSSLSPLMMIRLQPRQLPRLLLKVRARPKDNKLVLVRNLEPLVKTRFTLLDLLLSMDS